MLFIFLIVVGANVRTFGFDYLRISQRMMETAMHTHVDIWLGCVPVGRADLCDSRRVPRFDFHARADLAGGVSGHGEAGLDSLWFGVVLMIMAEVGLIHPPVGHDLFILQGINPTASMRTIALGALPFLPREQLSSARALRGSGNRAIAQAVAPLPPTSDRGPSWWLRR